MSERQAARDPYDEVIGSIAAMNSSKQFGAATVRVYSAALRDVPIDELRAVVWDLIKTRVFPPTVAEILSEVARRRLGLPEPYAAWEMMVEAVEGGDSKSLPEPILRALRTLGGTWAYRQSENPAIFRAQFLAAYKEFAAAAEGRVVSAIGPQHAKEIESGTTHAN